MATDTEAINLGNMRETVRRGWGDLSQPRLKGWQMAWARVTWRWEKELRCQTEMVLVFGNREKVNECTTGWTMSKGQLPGWGWRHWQGPELDKGLWSHSVESSFSPKNKWKPAEVWTSGRYKNLPSDLAVIHRRHLIRRLWSCLHPTVFFSFFIQGGLGSN